MFRFWLSSHKFVIMRLASRYVGDPLYSFSLIIHKLVSQLSGMPGGVGDDLIHL